MPRSRHQSQGPLHRQAHKRHCLRLLRQPRTASRIRRWCRPGHQGLGRRHHSAPEGSEGHPDLPSRLCLRCRWRRWCHPSQCHPYFRGRAHGLLSKTKRLGLLHKRYSTILALFKSTLRHQFIDTPNFYFPHISYLI